jgi:three-Cys-motif partner protein
MPGGIRDTIWPCDPHTRAKHEILKKYLQRWFPILGQTYREVLYVDGFCGPGIYQGGEPGSPIIAIDTAKQHAVRLGRTKVVFRFTDEREDRIAHLKSLLNQIDLPASFDAKADTELFDVYLSRLLDKVDRSGHIVPTFVFVDPFGYSGMPMVLMHRLLEHEHTEVFINLMTFYLHRLSGMPHEWAPEKFEEVFGTPEAHNLIKSGGNYEQIRQLYQRQLMKAADFVRHFSMHDRNGTLIYDLFFATNHEAGHIKMKEAMWAVDPDGDFRFSDATDATQAVLFRPNPTDDLLRLLISRYAGVESISVGDIQKWVEHDTPYLRKHVRPALQIGETRGVLRRLELTSSGRPRPPVQLNPDVRIDFTRGNPKQASMF